MKIRWALLIGLSLGVLSLLTAAGVAWAQEEGAPQEIVIPELEAMASDAEAVADDVVKTVDKAADAADADVDPVKAAMQREAERRNAQLSGLPYTWVVIDSPQEERDGTVTTYEGELVLYDMNKFAINNLWIMIAAMLVFIMHLGFACVESGLTRSKNTVNILFKNTMIPCIGLVMYAICGWMIMYPGDFNIIDGVLSIGFGIDGGINGAFDKNSPTYNEGYTVWTDFLFQGMFAATCATIVSGAVAGRIKLLPFLIFSVLFVGILYPITGSWQWGGGWLADAGFADFAGSTLVHAVGGAGALAGALILGPRIGKYAKDGTVQPIPGHNMPLATIGVFLLWFGWFGFNGGSKLSADPAGVSYVLVMTVMGACGGCLAAAACSWIFGGKPDLSMALNGILAGLVGITAGPDTVNWIEALILVGMVSGVICYFAVLLLDKLKIDDPVGAIAVHGVCGIYGTLCCGLWGVNGLFGKLIYGDDAGDTAGGLQLLTQVKGTLACVTVAFLFAAAVFFILKMTVGIRVSAEEEIEGLDLGEHDMSAYPDFQRTYIKSYHAREI